MNEVVLLYPNSTQLIIKGDEDIIKQILGQLNMMTIEYEIKSDDLIS